MDDNDLIKEFVNEVVRITPEYAKKERVRQAIQDVIVSLVSSGEIMNDSDLKNFFSSSEMSLKALKMVPFDVYSKLANR